MVTRETLHIFDLILKQLIRLSNVAVVQFINGLFNTEHPLDSTVEYPNTETVSRKLRKLMSDTLVIINGIYTYHIEGEISDDADIVVRVFEYGFVEGLRTKTVTDDDNVIEIRFPDARIIYWETSRNTPDEVTLRLKFPDGKYHDYKVKTLKFLNHDISELERQKLSILLPFYVLKLRKRTVSAKTSKQRTELAVEMKTILNELAAAVDHSEKAGLMNESDKRIVLGYIERLYRELFNQYKEFTEVDSMLRDRILTYSEEAVEKNKFEIAQRMLARGMALPEVAEIAELPIDKLQTLTPHL
jgi:hypothetical protein